MARRPSTDSIPNMPERVGRYELLLPIASGGMATVYLARSKGVGGFEREVALKLTHAHLRENPDFAVDLVEEAKLAVRIRHPNVVPVLDVGDDPLGVFLVMDYIEGDSLSGLMRRAMAQGGPLPMRIGIRVLIDALAGLHAAHELRDERGTPMNLVHRDFSPQNVLVGVDGVARLTDFGVAKAATRLTQTGTGLIKGKISYMSPEQARGHKLDRRSDVWAAGVMAWELLTGRRLYKSDNDVSTLLKLVSESPPRAGTVVQGIPPLLDETVAWALTPDLGQRCPNALLFAERLKSACLALGELAEAPEVGEWVQRLVGPKLHERQMRVAEVLRLRQRMGQLADTTDPSIKTPDSSVLSAGRASVDALLKEAEAADDTQQLVPTRRAEAAIQRDPARSVEQPTDTTSVGGLFRAAANGGKRRLAVGVAAGASLLIVWIAAWLSFGSRGESASAERRSAAATVASAPAGDTTASAAPSVDAAPEPEPLPATLLIRANAPVARLTVDGSPVAIVPPRAEVRVDLADRSPGRAVTIVAATSDGRHVQVKLVPGRDPVSLEFPALVRPAFRPTQPGVKPSPKPPIPASPYRK